MGRPSVCVASDTLRRDVNPKNVRNEEEEGEEEVEAEAVKSTSMSSGDRQQTAELKGETTSLAPDTALLPSAAGSVSTSSSSSSTAEPASSFGEGEEQPRDRAVHRKDVKTGSADARRARASGPSAWSIPPGARVHIILDRCNPGKARTIIGARV